MKRMNILTRKIVGLTILISITVFRSFILSQYVDGIMNIWHNIVLVLTLIPIDGFIAAMYGWWSQEKHLSFAIGFLPSTISLIIPIVRIISDVQGFFRTILIYGWFAIGMGLMGYGLAEWKDNGKRFFLGGITLWVVTLMLMIGSGS
jgi:hypothetical protein